MEPIAELAHDLRMPLQLMLSCAQLLRAEPGVADTPACAYADLLMDSVRAAQDMLERRLAPTEPARREAVELSGHLRRLCLRCAPEARSRGVRLTCRASAEPLAARLDAAALDRILMNLIANALRFTPPGGTVLVRLRALGDAAEIDVIDDGPGIPPEKLDRVFLEGETTGGHGLGLPIAAALARRLGGALTAASTPGRGATFTLRLTL